MAGVRQLLDGELLKSSRHWVLLTVLVMAREQRPSGDSLIVPQPASSWSAAAMQARALAPKAMFSLAAISWWASAMAPLPAAGVFRIWRSWVWVYRFEPSAIG